MVMLRRTGIRRSVLVCSRSFWRSVLVFNEADARLSCYLRNGALSCSAKQNLIYYNDPRSRSMFITPREVDIYSLYFERHTFIMLHEADLYLFNKANPYNATQSEYMPIVPRAMSRLPSPLRKWTMYPFTYTYTLWC